MAPPSVQFPKSAFTMEITPAPPSATTPLKELAPRLPPHNVRFLLPDPEYTKSVLIEMKFEILELSFFIPPPLSPAMPKNSIFRLFSIRGVVAPAPQIKSWANPEFCVPNWIFPAPGTSARLLTKMYADCCPPISPTPAPIRTVPVKVFDVLVRCTAVPAASVCLVATPPFPLMAPETVQ